MCDKLKYYLLIDTSTEVCTVALGTSDGEIIAEKRNDIQNKHAEVLAPLSNELLSMIPAGSKLSGIGIAEGPGSYTGLRIGAAYAKGLCWTEDIPLVSITTPELLARTLSSKSVSEETLLMPMIDARRMEVYSAVYAHDFTTIREISALILTEEETMNSFAKELGDSPILYFGSGAEKAIEVMSHHFKNASFAGKISPSAGAMLPVVIEKISSDRTEDIAYWEPHYLKEYEAKKSTNKVLRKIVDK